MTGPTILQMAVDTHYCISLLTSPIHIDNNFNQILQTHIHHSIRPVVTDFQSSSFVIWNGSAFSLNLDVLSFLLIAFWEPPCCPSNKRKDNKFKLVHSILVFYSHLKHMPYNHCTLEKGQFKEIIRNPKLTRHSCQ